MKILRSKKALSPVVASIILIAVTVAVSIAVAAWMGALTFSFMGTEQLTVQKISWTWLGAGNRYFTVTVNNTGTKDVTIQQIMVNYVGVSGAEICTHGNNWVTVAVPYILKASGAQRAVSFDVKYDYNNGTNYDISVVTSDNYKFTNTFQGGTNAG